MARIRSIKPEIRRSLTVCAWPYPIRWTFVGLPGYLDDAGRGHDDTRLIKAELYPLDDDMTAKKIDKHLTTIAETGPLCRYEVDGKRYLHVTSFGEHQRVNRPSPSRIPPCPIHEIGVKPHAPLTEASSPHAQARVPAEQGREQGAGSKELGEEQGKEGAAAAAEHDRGPHLALLLDKPLTDLGIQLPRQTRTALAGHVERLVADGLPDQVITAAVTEWARRPGSKPGLLPHLAGDLAKATSSDQPSPDVAAWIAEQQALATANGTRP